MNKKYVLVGNKDLGLLHPAIDEFYSIPDNIESRFPPDRMPSQEARYALMHGLMQETQRFMAIPPYYFIAPLEKRDFFEIKGTVLDAVINGVKAYDEDVPESLIRNKWEQLEKFDSLFSGKLHLIPVKYPPYAKTPVSNFKTRRRTR